jgi:threonine/homoserine/homoserine lactone efflux protein
LSPSLPSAPLLSAFLVASVVLAVTPGPGVLYIVTRSLAQGRRSGLASVAGVALGNLGNALAASLGLVALFAVSQLAFTVVKLAGALYLILLGCRTLRAPRDGAETIAPPPTPLARVLRDGFVVALLNPKTALFFAAFLPQFAGGDAPLGRNVALGATFVAIAALSDTLYALLAGSLAPALWRVGGWRAAGRTLTGGTLIGLGVIAAASGQRR